MITLQSEPNAPRHLLLRASCWVVALALGAAQAWSTRFGMNPDGVSYLDIGEAYWGGDWHNAINAYWSPLYSWILGFALRIAKPTANEEYSLAHWVNLGIYVVALACFEYLLVTLAEERRPRQRDLLLQGRSGIAESAWWLLGYSLFLSSSLLLIGLRLVSPDLLVSALFYLAAALFVKVRANAGPLTHALFGFVLGLGFLAKSVMFPVGVLLLACAFPGSKVRFKSWLLSALVFSAVTTPFIVLISHAQGRFTIGESGRWNYLVFVNGVKPFFPQDSLRSTCAGETCAPVAVHEFAGVLGGTYPPWQNPSYWQRGIPLRVQFRNQLVTMGQGLKTYWGLVSSSLLQFAYTTGLIVLVILFRPRIDLRTSSSWLLLPILATLFAYDLLIVEHRYIGGVMAVLWLLVYGAVHSRSSPESKNLIRFTVVCVAVAGLLPILLFVILQLRSPIPPTHIDAAQAIAARKPENPPLALIWDEDWQTGAAEGSFVPRLLKAKVVSEAEPAREFWSARPQVRAEVIRRLFATGAETILTRRPPQGAAFEDCWQRLGNTDFYACFR
jgi:hypothetical protein